MKKIVSLICVLALCITGLSMAASAAMVEGYTITTATSADGQTVRLPAGTVGYNVSSVSCSVASAQAKLSLYLKSYTNPFYGYHCDPDYIVKKGYTKKCRWPGTKEGPYLVHMEAQNNTNSAGNRINVVVYGDFGNA